MAGDGGGRAGGAPRTIDLANRARDRANVTREPAAFLEAAALYELALHDRSDDGPNQIQCGHMFKEAGRLADAERHYRAALALMPDDADLWLQMGHFFKTGGRLSESESAYLRAVELAPEWSEPQVHLQGLYRAGFRGYREIPSDALSDVLVSVGQPRGGSAPRFSEQLSKTGLLGALEGLAPELAPRHPNELFHSHGEFVEIRRFGRWERSRWGMTITLRGVEAIRGFCVSASPVRQLQVTANGQSIYLAENLEGFPLKNERDNTQLRKYIFNIWLDFGVLRDGRYEIALRFIMADHQVRVHREYAMISTPSSERDHPDSDGVVEIAPGDPRSVEEQINARPSMIRSAQRTLLPAIPETVLVLRIDQLGDMVASTPALRRLREILPTSRLVGLVSPSNVGLAEDLNVFDETIAVDIPDDELEKRRILTINEQVKLRARLAPYKFDMAIDLSHVNMSQPLMFLSDAPFLFGFNPRENSWLSAGLDGEVTHDFANGLECVSHATKVMCLVEVLGVLLRSHARIERRSDPSRILLEPFGIAASDKFALFHTGARIAFSRWPHYLALASRVLERDAVKVVVIADGPDLRSKAPQSLKDDDRFILIDTPLSFDEFDAFVSNCSVLVGNDSGPKHLGALRGANVVSIHSSRINWNEWGQEGSGSIISRRVPCAGCRIHHDPEECGKEFACINNITTDEVYSSIERYINY